MEPEASGGRPILLFLHGVGTGDPDGNWKSRLSATLAAVGYPGFDTVRVIAPRYAHALKGSDDEEDVPPTTIRQPAGDAARRNRREFERRTSAIELRLGRQERGDGVFGGDALVDFAVGAPFFEQARNYIRKPKIRAQVLNKVLAALPDEGRIVIVGHSLGSVIAADLLRRLPPGLAVVGMVTIGSPLANDNFGVDDLRDELREPPTNLAWWVSFWDHGDPVAARRGVSSVFPWVIDFRVRTSALGPAAAHQAVEYLAHEVVAEAVGFALFGSRSKELAPIERSVDIPPDVPESLALLALRYAQLIVQRLEGDQQDRFSGALRGVQAQVVELLSDARRRSGRPVPADVLRLDFDSFDSDAPRPEPQPARYLPKQDAVVPLTILLSENIILPFEISVPLDIRQGAMEDLTAEMGLGSAFGADLFASAQDAQKTVAGVKPVIWWKWGALAAGAAALVVATGGLALAAGGGLIGAAAITSALAAFGPGGMIGGLLTAGTLVTAGGGGIAFALTKAETAVETVEAVITSQLTAELLRKKRGLDRDPAIWSNLVEMEMTLRREHERLDEFSDDSAPSVKALKRKLEVVERVLARLAELELAPGQGLATDVDDASADASEPWYMRLWPAAR